MELILKLFTSIASVMTLEMFIYLVAIIIAVSILVVKLTLKFSDAFREVFKSKKMAQEEIKSFLGEELQKIQDNLSQQIGDSDQQIKFDDERIKEILQQSVEDIELVKEKIENLEKTLFVLNKLVEDISEDQKHVHAELTRNINDIAKTLATLQGILLVSNMTVQRSNFG